jgi:crotonobetainyl-CoA:carnitine CoA-transferase CaiB-like acyl-CoA transferase
MKVTMPHSLAGKGTVDVIGSPIKLGETPVDYRLPPPYCGQHTDEVLRELLYLSDDDLSALRAKKVI